MFEEYKCYGCLRHLQDEDHCLLNSLAPTVVGTPAEKRLNRINAVLWLTNLCHSQDFLDHY